MVFETIIEPVLFRLETDQDASRPSVSRDEDLLRLGEAQEAREIVLDLSECDLADPAPRAGRASAPLRPS